MKKITFDLQIGISSQMWEALKTATEFQATSGSQLGRRYLLEGLVREGFLQPPQVRIADKRAGNP